MRFTKGGKSMKPTRKVTTKTYADGSKKQIITNILSSGSKQVIERWISKPKKK